SGVTPQAPSTHLTSTSRRRAVRAVLGERVSARRHLPCRWCLLLRPCLVRGSLRSRPLHSGVVRSSTACGRHSRWFVAFTLGYWFFLERRRHSLLSDACYISTMGNRLHLLA